MGDDDVNCDINQHARGDLHVRGSVTEMHNAEVTLVTLVNFEINCEF